MKNKWSLSAQQKWRKNNPEKWGAIVNRYKKSGKSQAAQRRYYQNNKKRILALTNERHRLYRLQNPDRVRNRDRLWAKTLKGRWASYKKNASHAGREFNLSVGDFLIFWQSPCNYCGDAIETIGLDRIDNTKGYTLDNVIVCCKVCNLMKKDMKLEDFFGHITKIYVKRQA